MFFIEILYIIIISRVTDLLFRMLADVYNSATNTPREIMKAVSESYSIKEDLEDIKDVDRVMLFNAHTNKSIKDLSNPIRISSIWGNSKSIKKWREDVAVDSEYIKMLRNLADKEYYVFETDKEKPSLLKSIYEEEGIKRSVIFFLKYKYKQKSLIGHLLRLKGKKTGFYYISIGNKSGSNLTGDTEVIVRENLAKLNSILTDG